MFCGNESATRQVRIIALAYPSATARRAPIVSGELIDRIASGAPIRKLLFIEAFGHTRMPFAGFRPDHRAGIELTTIDADRAAEAAADLEGRSDGSCCAPSAAGRARNM
jgi:hypothetical protein